MSLCGKLHPTLRMKCARGKAHVANGLPHRSTSGYAWPLDVVDVPEPEAKPTSANDELRAAIRAAVEQRVARMRRGAAKFEQLARFNYFLEIAVDEIEEMRIANGRLYGQNYTKRRFEGNQ